MAKKFFLDQGVKMDNLIFENRSRNTFENIKYLSYNDLNLNKLYLQNEKIFRDYVKSLFDFEKLH